MLHQNKPYSFIYNIYVDVMQSDMPTSINDRSIVSGGLRRNYVQGSVKIVATYNYWTALTE